MTRRIAPRGCLLRDDLKMIVDSDDAGSVEGRRGRRAFFRDRVDVPVQNTTDLAYRQGAGIEVTLLWHRRNGELTVSVTDTASGASFELPVAPDEALAAFHHPYAYAAVKNAACLAHLGG